MAGEERERCGWCGGDAVPGSCCPRSLTCPTCGAGPGSPCRRPSGHRADTLHAARVRDAEQLDAEAGVSTPPDDLAGATAGATTTRDHDREE